MGGCVASWQELQAHTRHLILCAANVHRVRSAYSDGQRHGAASGVAHDSGSRVVGAEVLDEVIDDLKRLSGE